MHCYKSFFIDIVFKPSCNAPCLVGFGFPSWVYFSKDVSSLAVLSSLFLIGFVVAWQYYLLWISEDFELWLVHLFCTRRLYLFSRNNVAFPQEVISHFPRKSYLFPQESIFLSPGSHISFLGKPHFYPQKVVSFLQSSMITSNRYLYLSNSCFHVQVDVTFFYFLYEWLAYSPSSV